MMSGCACGVTLLRRGTPQVKVILRSWSGQGHSWSKVNDAVILRHTRCFASKPIPATQVPPAEINGINNKPKSGTRTNKHYPKTTPSPDKLAGQGSGNDGENNNQDLRTIFHKPSQYLVNINLEPPESQITLFFRKTNSLVNIKRKRRPEVDMQIDEKDVDEPVPRSIEDHMWRPISAPEWNELPKIYAGLSKSRLTALVALTAMAGYAVAPFPFYVDKFLLLTAGTALTSAAANSINQVLEVPYDSQMKRTQNRVLVRGLVSPLHGSFFALAASTLGLTLLGFGLNPLTAGLGALNLGLYTFIYTPMKRHSMANTWVGAVVGAIPPLMGWAACSGGLDPGAFVLAGIMFSWQFPHFNALSWNLRPEYSRAGYHMMSVLNPALCKRVALRHSVALIGLCTLAPVFDVTTWFFAVDSLPLNLCMCYLAWKFYRDGDSKSSRNLFKFTLLQLPVLIVLMLISKKSFRHNAEARAAAEKAGLENTPVEKPAQKSALEQIKKVVMSMSQV